MGEVSGKYVWGFICLLGMRAGRDGCLIIFCHSCFTISNQLKEEVILLMSPWFFSYYKMLTTMVRGTDDYSIRTLPV